MNSILKFIFRLFTPDYYPTEAISVDPIPKDIEEETPYYVKDSIFIKPALLQNPVVQQIITAAALIGVPRSTLVAIAGVESAFNPKAKAPTSSASGLFQFINGTWAAMVTKYGVKYGIGINDRFDAEKSSIMGALFLKENIDYLESKLKRPVGIGESYLAHFAGAGTAIKLLAADPNTRAKDHVSAAVVNANRSIFIKNGLALSVADVIKNFNVKLLKVIS